MANQAQQKQSIIKKKFIGEVVSAGMNKTIVVRVDNLKLNPRYNKRYQASRKYKVHDDKGQFKVGDRVEFVECRPLSKDKKWRVIYN
ncbi:MAG TPA: 30S ribosomal protein S17 [bacterium]|nr:30S ribosomal protein S17 [bacterium]HNS34286.1 30S ribosomal protein S17 [bacterium]HOH67144.1 30S ribosomal protein S17 [bacterium]